MANARYIVTLLWVFQFLFFKDLKFTEFYQSIEQANNIASPITLCATTIHQEKVFLVIHLRLHQGCL